MSATLADIGQKGVKKQHSVFNQLFQDTIPGCEIQTVCWHGFPQTATRIFLKPS
jgi:hypothetical protein